MEIIKKDGNGIISKIVEGVKNIFNKDNFGEEPVNDINPYYEARKAFDESIVISPNQMNKDNSYFNISTKEEKLSSDRTDPNSPIVVDEETR